MKINFYILLVFVAGLSSCNRNQYTPIAPQEKTASSHVVEKSIPDTISYRTPTYPTHFYTLPPETIYTLAQKELRDMLEDEQLLSLKRAVFITENAYFDNSLSYPLFCYHLSGLAAIAKSWSQANKLEEYPYPDSTNTLLNAAIFYTLTDTVFSTEGTLVNLPYTYDFNDCFAKEEWANMFVVKLLATHQGNCHSLPILYKLLAEELNVTAWLSFAPNHIYLRNWSKKNGWYNTEMTNALFPNEAWIMASGYVSRASIVSGIYMDTLSLKQSVVVCLNDLAKGYLRKSKAPDLSFVLQCCDLGLAHYPNYAELLLLKAETHKSVYQSYVKAYGLNIQNPTDSRYKEVAYHLAEMNKAYGLLAQYDYREIPEEMFLAWIQALENNGDKYQNKKITTTFKHPKP